MNFLRYDNPVMAFISKMVDYVCVGILWVVFSLPVVTGGAALTAALLTIEIAIRKEEGRILKTFWKWFRKEFRQSTILWLIQLPLVALAVGNVLWTRQTDLPNVVQSIIFVVSGIIFCWTQLWFGYLSKFEDTLRTVLANSFRILLGNLGTGLLLAILAILAGTAMVVTFLWIAPLMTLVPGLYLLAYSALMRKLLNKFLPKEEPAPEAIEE